MSDPLETARADDRTVLTEAESKRLLADAGVAVPAFSVAETTEQAVAEADAIGYPVVVKVASPAVKHKTEWGGGIGVAVGLQTPAAVREAADRIFDRAFEAGVDAAVLVETAADVDAGTEVIVGGVRRQAFGPTVIAGMGGVFAEVLEDLSHRLAPIDHEEAMSMLHTLKGVQLLRGYRGRPAADLDELADAIVTIGDLMAAETAIREIDVNPMLATSDGATALDALVVLVDDG